MAQVLHVLGTKYDGDKIALKYKRAGKTVAIAALELTGKNVLIAQPFLGILPMRDDPKLGVEVRFVYPQSPAEKIGLKAGDRILKYGTDEKALQEFKGDKRGRNEFNDWLNTLYPGAEVKLGVQRKGADKTETLTVALGDIPGSIPGVTADLPEQLPQPASMKKALAQLELNNPNVKNPKIVEQKRRCPTPASWKRTRPTASTNIGSTSTRITIRTSPIPCSSGCTRRTRTARTTWRHSAICGRIIARTITSFW